MKRPLTIRDYDVQTAGPQYLENLATGYWFSEVLFTAVEMDLFSLVGTEGATLDELSRALDANSNGLKRFLHALEKMGLLTSDGPRYFNTKLSDNYLVCGKDLYQGDSILWRKDQHAGWQGMKDCLKVGGRVDYSSQDNPSSRNRRIHKYIRAMDGIAKTKAQELVSFFADRQVTGDILDVGAGSGAISAAFLERFPKVNAVFLDLPDVLECARVFVAYRGFDKRTRYCPANILAPWQVSKQSFDLVILSNILHAYSEKELPHILQSAAACLTERGILLIHDFFLEHCPEKAALSDLNMFINTHNGKVFQGTSVQELVRRLGLFCTDLVPLGRDTAVLFGAHEESGLMSLCLDATDLLVSRIRAQGFRKVYRIQTEDIHIADWTDVRCRFGCEKYGNPPCPPNSPSSSKTREIVKDYKKALLLEGKPPTRDFQMRVLQAERAAFKAGFHKAFSFWAGPCSLCVSCAENECCNNMVNSRPSMEGAGIDVFETARKAGATLKTLEQKNEFVKYFALLLLE
jgi:predicted metal-binding protein/ubiquinone/menaquinone biosynthesis C-methylase UbiE